MYTQSQKALSILLLTSILLQSCGTNFMLGEQRSEMRKQKEEATQQAPLPSAERASLHSQPKTGHASVSPPLQPEASQAPPYTPKAAWKARQQRTLKARGLPLSSPDAGLPGGMLCEGAGEEKGHRPSPTGEDGEESAALTDGECSSQPSPPRSPASSRVPPLLAASKAAAAPDDDKKEESELQEHKPVPAADFHSSLERLHSNDPRLLSLDLRQVPLTSDHLQALDQALASNTVLGYIHWGTLPQDQEAQMLQAQMHEKLVRNTLQYEYHPTDLVHALLAKHVYKMPEPGQAVDFALAWPEMPAAWSPLAQGWTVAQVTNDRNASWADALGVNTAPGRRGKTGFYSALYVNEAQHQVVLCFQGTKFQLSDLVSERSDVEADINGILAAEIHTQQYLAHEATRAAIEYAQARGFHLSITGHSLGGFLAELAVFFCYHDFDYRTVQGIVFDSPGSLDWLEGVQSNIVSRATAFEAKDLPLTTYLSSPNPVNSGDGHPGLVYRLDPAPTALPQLAQLVGSVFVSRATMRQLNATTGHMLSVLLPCFDPTLGRPREEQYKRVADWPKLRKEQIPSLKRPSDPDLPPTNARVVGLLRNLHRASTQLNVTLSSLEATAQGQVLEGEAAFRQQYEGHYQEHTLGFDADVLDRDTYQGVDSYLEQLWHRRQEVLENPMLSPLTQRLLSAMASSYRVEARGGKAVVRTTYARHVSDVRRQMQRVLAVLPREEVRQALDASRVVATPPAQQLHSHIAQAKLKDYVPREEAQMQLMDHLASHGVCVLAGHGGAGKSTLAAEYAHQQKEQKGQHRTVYWLSAETPSKLLEGLEQMADELEIPYRTLAEEHKEDKRAYFQRLSRLIYQKVHGQPILLILDNAEAATKELIDASLANRPQSVQVVITTRASRLFRGYEHVLLHAFSPAEGAKYLQQRFSSMGRPLEEAMQARLLSEVGLIPQPLALATGYLEEYETKSVAWYLDRLQSIRGGAVQAGEGMVLPQVALGLEGLASAAQQILRYGAYLDADYMPLALFTSLVGTPEEVDSCINQLGRLSLVTVVRKEGEEVGIQIHREVQKACRQYGGWQEEAVLEEAALLQRVVEVLSERMPWVEKMPDARWAAGALYAPHAAAVLGEYARGARASLSPCEAHARLLARLGHYQDVAQCNFEEAKDYLEEALAMRRALHPGNHTDVAESMSNVGRVYQDMGQLQEAKASYEEALAMRRALHPGNHPDVAVSLDSVGDVYQALGQLQEAKDYLEEALAMRRALHPGNQPDVAESLNNVGVVYQALGQLQEAKDYQEQALVMIRALHPGNHPHLATSMSNLGLVYQAMGQLQQAKDYQEQALVMIRALHPGNHPHLAASMSNLGLVYQAMGQLQQAKVYQEQALVMRRALHPGNHPDVATSLNNLGSVYQDMGQLQEAKVYLEEALEMFRALHPGNHPHMAASMSNLGRVYQDLGQLQEAKAYLEEALAMRRALHPGNHPDVAESLNNLGSVYYALGQLQQAKVYQEQALEMYRALHPGNHPDVAISLYNVGSVYEALRDNTTALNYYQEALRMYEAVLPAHHRYIQMVRRGVQRMEAKLARPSCSIS